MHSSSSFSSPSPSFSARLSLLLICTLAALLHNSVPSLAAANIEPVESSCAQMAGSDEERLLLCQLYESSALLAQLGALVNDGIERLAATQGLGKAITAVGLSSPVAADGVRMEKRKHEYLRFGKRKHEFVRFGRK